MKNFYKYLIFIFIGILLFLLLNGREGFSVGGTIGWASLKSGRNPKSNDPLDYKFYYSHTMGEGDIPGDIIVFHDLPEGIYGLYPAHHGEEAYEQFGEVTFTQYQPPEAGGGLGAVPNLDPPRRGCAAFPPGGGGGGGSGAGGGVMDIVASYTTDGSTGAVIQAVDAPSLDILLSKRWVQLDGNQRRYLTALGWNADGEDWNKPDSITHSVKTNLLPFFTPWSRFTDEEVLAARELGITEEEWRRMGNSLMDLGKAQGFGDTGSGIPITTLGWNIEDWERRDIEPFLRNWNCLSAREQELAILIFKLVNQHAESLWNDNSVRMLEYRSVLLKDWNSISQNQKTALSTLGWLRTTWDGREQPRPLATPPRLSPSIMDKPLNEFTDEEKQAIYDIGLCPFLFLTWTKCWEGLSPAQIANAQLLGMNRFLWNTTNGLDSVIFSPGITRLITKSWSQFTDVQKDAAHELGINEQRWGLWVRLSEKAFTGYLANELNSISEGLMNSLIDAVTNTASVTVTLTVIVRDTPVGSYGNPWTLPISTYLLSEDVRGTISASHDSNYFTLASDTSGYFTGWTITLENGDTGLIINYDDSSKEVEVDWLLATLPTRILHSNYTLSEGINRFTVENVDVATEGYLQASAQHTVDGVTYIWSRTEVLYGTNVTPYIFDFFYVKDRFNKSTRYSQ